MNGSHFRTQHKALVITVNHDNGAYEPRSNTPASLPPVMLLLIFVDKRDIKDLGKVLTQIMAGAHLQLFPIRHHGFHRCRVKGAREFFTVSLLAYEHRYRQVRFNEVLVLSQCVENFLFRFFSRCVHRVAFLPEELACSEEWFGGFGFPPNDVAPLVKLDWQVSPASNPLGERSVHYRLGCGAFGQFLFEFSMVALRYP